MKRPRHRTASSCVLALALLACGEHVTFHGDTANGLISLSVAAGATERIRLMSAITLLPLYRRHPAAWW